MFLEKFPLQVLDVYAQRSEHICLTQDRVHERVFCIHTEFQKYFESQYSWYLRPMLLYCLMYV